MLNDIFHLLQSADSFFWGYVGFSLIVTLGVVLTLQTRCFQLRALPLILNSIKQDVCGQSQGGRGLHPLRVFFASVGGMLGVGNIVGIVTAIQLGGPGALLWVWIAGMAGTLIKYSEIYLGLRYREQNDRGGYDGGPMYFLRKAFGVRWVSGFVCVLLCLYGAEIYQFNVVIDTITASWGTERLTTACCLLGLILYAVLGGVSRVAQICCWIMPFFMLAYVSMCIWLIGNHLGSLPDLFVMVVKSAFTGHAAVGGFAGSTVLLAIQNGMASACYAADIGIGYDSIIQSESRVTHPEKQARFALVGVIMDNFICTLSIAVVLVTGLWQTSLDAEGVPLVQMALAQAFPFMDAIMPFFVFILGYTTLIAYLIVGIKCARYLHPKVGEACYLAYSIAAFLFFAFFDQNLALLVMRIAGGLLLIFNLSGLFLLRREIVFAHSEVEIEAKVYG